MASRYSAHGAEAEFEPGTRRRVLRNVRGIRSVREMAWVESECLIEATQRMIDATQTDQRFTPDDICNMHRMWLGSVYEWAGEYRQVNITKGDFMFAAAARVPRLMLALAKGPLTLLTPCRFSDIGEQSNALAVVHTELVLIHPFREGNGRCARLLAVLMALQAGLPILDFGGIRGQEKRRYIGAIHAGLDQNYAPMTRIFRRVIERTMRLHANA
jgi:cell filamentation protein